MRLDVKTLSSLGGAAIIIAIALLAIPFEGPSRAWVATLVGAILFTAVSEHVLASRCSPRGVGSRGAIRLFMWAGTVPILGVLHAATGWRLIPLHPVWGLALPAALVLAGCALRHASLRALGPFFVQAISIQEGHRLVREGPYRWVRNPALVGYFLFTLGLLLLTRSAPALGFGLLLSGLAIREFVRQEEAALSLALGDAYRQYHAAVGRYLPRPTQVLAALGRGANRSTDTPHGRPDTE